MSNNKVVYAYRQTSDMVAAIALAIATVSVALTTFVHKEPPKPPNFTHDEAMQFLLSNVRIGLMERGDLRLVTTTASVQGITVAVVQAYPDGLLRSGIFLGGEVPPVGGFVHLLMVEYSAIVGEPRYPSYVIIPAKPKGYR